MAFELLISDISELNSSFTTHTRFELHISNLSRGGHLSKNGYPEVIAFRSLVGPDDGGCGVQACGLTTWRLRSLLAPRPVSLRLHPVVGSIACARARGNVLYKKYTKHIRFCSSFCNISYTCMRISFFFLHTKILQTLLHARNHSCPDAAREELRHLGHRRAVLRVRLADGRSACPNEVHGLGKCWSHSVFFIDEVRSTLASFESSLCVFLFTREDF